jgi:TP53 regulating kinase and related kinases
MAASSHPLPTAFTHTTPPPGLVAQGAEALLYKTTFLTPSTPAALKVRPSKPYRHPVLDRRLTRQRILQEARCLVKLVREGVQVPTVLAVDWAGDPSGHDDDGDIEGRRARARGGAWLLMEWIEGPTVRVVLERWEVWMKKSDESSSNTATTETREQMEEDQERTGRVRDLMRRIGHVVGGMHQAGVVHGDLTTSNLILRPSAVNDDDDGEATSTIGYQRPPIMDGEIVLIDFGLAGQSVHEEDRAVDLYVLERAFGSTHPRTEVFFGDVLVAYRESFKGANVVLKRLEDVRLRGRKRSMVG